MSQLLQRGANLECKPADAGRTPLVTAIRNGHAGLVKLLLSHDANICTRDASDYLALATEIDDSVKLAMRKEIVKLVIKHSEREPRKLLYAERVLMQAVSRADEKLVTILLEVGANPNASDQRGNTPLMTAAVEDSINIINMLIDAGAQVDLGRGQATSVFPIQRLPSLPAGSNDLRTALSIAMEAGKVRAVKLLCSKGAKADALDRFERTALWWAENCHGSREIIEVLKASASQKAEDLPIRAREHKGSDEGDVDQPEPIEVDPPNFSTVE